MRCPRESCDRRSVLNALEGIVMNGKQWLVVAAVIILGGVGTAAMVADYSTIPPAAKDLHVRLDGSETKLLKAVQLAEELTGGIAQNAKARIGSAEINFEVETVSAEKVERVIVMENGTVSSRTVVPRFPGSVVSPDTEMQRTDSGLAYFDLVVGGGETPPAATSTVKVHYSGYLVDGTKFDSSLDRGQPASFPLNRVIRGWTEGVGSMQVGGKRKLIIPSSLAYGPQGRPPTIPGGATLIFDVELLEIVE